MEPAVQAPQSFSTIRLQLTHGVRTILRLLCMVHSMSSRPTGSSSPGDFKPEEYKTIEPPSCLSHSDTWSSNTTCEHFPLCRLSTCQTMAEPAQIAINGANFSRYECQIACAIKLFVKNANNAVPTDETIGFIINSLRGIVNGVPLPCNTIVSQLQSHPLEGVRSCYMSVYVNRGHWEREAGRVWYAWLKQNNNVVKRCVSSCFLHTRLRGD